MQFLSKEKYNYKYSLFRGGILQRTWQKSNEREMSDSSQAKEGFDQDSLKVPSGFRRGITGKYVFCHLESVLIIVLKVFCILIIIL